MTEKKEGKLYVVRGIDSKIVADFQKACKSLGIKQNATISAYMEYVTDRAKKVEAMRSFSEFTELDMYFNKERLTVEIRVEDEEQK
jgi:hypothetical protein